MFWQDIRTKNNCLREKIGEYVQLSSIKIIAKHEAVSWKSEQYLLLIG